MEGLQAEARVTAIVRLAEAFAVRGFERERVEQNSDDEVESPHFVRLSETVDATHLSFLVGRGEDTTGPHLSRYGLEKVLAVLWSNVLAQLGQELRGPFSLDLG